MVARPSTACRWPTCPPGPRRWRATVRPRWRRRVWVVSTTWKPARLREVCASESCLRPLDTHPPGPAARQDGVVQDVPHAHPEQHARDGDHHAVQRAPGLKGREVLQLRHHGALRNHHVRRHGAAAGRGEQSAAEQGAWEDRVAEGWGNARKQRCRMRAWKMCCKASLAQKKIDSVAISNNGTVLETVLL